MSLRERVAEFISREALLAPGERLVAAVSGGPDSLALLLLLQQLGYRPVVAHLDHGLRPDSRADAAFVEALVARWGLPFRSDRADPSRWHGSTETAARTARYAFLFRVANKEGLNSVVTGHTADDQIESILMHFLRGAGPQGLAGMRPATDASDWRGFGAADTDGIRIVRPLLCVDREETAAYCRAEGLDARADPSNRDLTFLRNRVRHELLPQLRQYNPGVDQAILRTGRVMRALANWVDDELSGRWPELARRAGPAALALGWDRMAGLPLPLQRQAWRRALLALDPEASDLAFTPVERAVEYLAAGGAGVATLTGEIQLERAGPEAVLYRRGTPLDFPNVPQIETRMTVDLDSRLELGGGWSLRFEWAALAEGERAAIQQGHAPYAEPGVEAMDRARIQGKLTLRRPRAGDRFRPLGMRGTIKISDFFINQGVPRLHRANWPLLVDEGAILWVVGLRLGEGVRVGARTREIVRAELRRDGGRPAPERGRSG